MIPIKTGDIVYDATGSYIVREIRYSKSEPVLIVSEVSKKVIPKYAASVDILDKATKEHRIKATRYGVDSTTKNEEDFTTIRIPKSVDSKKLLAMIQELKRETGNG